MGEVDIDCCTGNMQREAEVGLSGRLSRVDGAPPPASFLGIEIAKEHRRVEGNRTVPVTVFSAPVHSKIL